MTTLTIDRLQIAVADDVAIRFVARLQPAGGRGDKVFPPTYAGGQYANEERIDAHGEVKKVVLLDSVQSQANRMEQALLAAYRAGRVQLPLVTVDFSGHGELREIGEITVLDAPHRLADAILRDSCSTVRSFPPRPRDRFSAGQHRGMRQSCSVCARRPFCSASGNPRVRLVDWA
jgi:CRISPR-associated protein Csb1